MGWYTVLILTEINFVCLNANYWSCDYNIRIINYLIVIIKKIDRSFEHWLDNLLWDQVVDSDY